MLFSRLPYEAGSGVGYYAQPQPEWRSATFLLQWKDNDSEEWK